MLSDGLPLFAVALVFSFCFFAFFANSLNPFATPRRGSSRHRRVKYIRYVAIALFLGLSLTLVLYQVISQPVAIAALAGAALVAVMVFLPTIRYYDIKLPFSSKSKKSPPESQNVPTPQAEEKEESAYVNEPLPPMQAQALTPVKTSTENDVDFRQSIISTEEYSLEDETELQQRISSDEYAMEIEIAKATAHIDDDLTNLDQSIAEAEFEAVHSAQTNTSDIATPAFTASGLNKAMNEEPEFDSPNVDSKIAALLDEHESLTNAHQELKGENAKLHNDLIRKDAVVRKSVAEKNQAIEVKDKAIRIAAMERKKRKLTEIQARKIIMKLKQNALRLETDNVNS